MTSFADSPEQFGAENVTGEARRERLRFTSFNFRRSPSGYGSAEVVLEWQEGEAYTGRAEGVSSAYGDLRLGSEATLVALGKFLKGTVTFELVGVKALRAFDANVVVVRIVARRDGKEFQLLGCHLAADDPVRSSVVATLQATNRLLGLVTRQG